MEFLFWNHWKSNIKTNETSKLLSIISQLLINYENRKHCLHVRMFVIMLFFISSVHLKLFVMSLDNYNVFDGTRLVVLFSPFLFYLILSFFMHWISSPIRNCLALLSFSAVICVFSWRWFQILYYILIIEIGLNLCASYNLNAHHTRNEKKREPPNKQTNLELDQIVLRRRMKLCTSN